VLFLQLFVVIQYALAEIFPTVFELFNFESVESPFLVAAVDGYLRNISGGYLNGTEQASIALVMFWAPPRVSHIFDALESGDHRISAEYAFYFAAAERFHGC
jgi:hypothetical protein